MTWPSDEDVEKAAEAAYLGYKTRNQPWNARSHVAKEAWRECARAALSAVNPYEWRPIDDAAKSGDEILACSVTAATGAMLVRWMAPVEFMTDSEVSKYLAECGDDTDEPDWFYADFIEGGRLTPDCYPTHYVSIRLPFPYPPEGDK